MNSRSLVCAFSVLLGGCASVPMQEATIVPALTNAAAPEPGVVTAGQFGADDIPAIEGSRIRHVIDLTQASETPGFDEESVLASSAIGYSRLAISGAEDLTRANVDAFDALLSGVERPVLVHCRSSNRVGAMAALRAAWIGGQGVEEALAVGRAWGLTSMEPAVRAKLEAQAAR